MLLSRFIRVCLRHSGARARRRRVSAWRINATVLARYDLGVMSGLVHVRHARKSQPMFTRADAYAALGAVLSVPERNRSAGRSVTREPRRGALPTVSFQRSVLREPRKDRGVSRGAHLREFDALLTGPSGPDDGAGGAVARGDRRGLGANRRRTIGKTPERE